MPCMTEPNREPMGGSEPEKHDPAAPDPGDSRDHEHAPDQAYDLEPAEAVEGSSDGLGTPSPTSTDGPDPEGVDLVCPACGEAMPGSDQVVCLTCGHDLVTGRKVGETPGTPTSKGGVVATDEDADEEADLEVVAGSGNLVWLIVAGVAVVFTLFAILAGWSSLFPSTDGRYADSDGAFTLDAPRIAVRLATVIRFVVASSVVVGCGAIALRTAAWIESRPVGSASGGLARLLAIVTVAALARLIPVESSMLQGIVHLLLSVGVVVGGSMLVFGLRGRIAVLHLMTWALLLLIVVPASRLVAWSMPLW